MNFETRKKYIERAKNHSYTVSISIKDFNNLEELIMLVQEAKDEKVEVRIWNETSNMYQGVLVELQRFENRVHCHQEIKDSVDISELTVDKVIAFVKEQAEQLERFQSAN